MKTAIRFSLALLMLLSFAHARAEDYAEAIEVFKGAGESSSFFKKSYGYALFPTIGKAGMGIGGAHGKGKVYEKGRVIGTAKMNQLTVGLQLGGQAYS